MLDFSTVNIINGRNDTLSVYGLSADCNTCDPELLTAVVGRGTSVVVVDGRFLYTFTFGGINLPNLTYESTFGDRGTYNATVTEGITVTTVADPNETWLPILVAAIALCVLSVVFPLLVRLFDAFLAWVFQGVDGASPPPAPKVTRARVRSLDTFRGMSLSIMIFVNYGGGGYWFFSHSTWDGLTVADLVFPWFIFMMGVSLSIVQDGQSRKNDGPRIVLWIMFRRSCAMFWLGLFLDSSKSGGVQLTRLRIPGVLQRFAISYFVNAVALFLIPTATNGADAESVRLNETAEAPQEHPLGVVSAPRFREITPYRLQWAFFLAIHAAWFIATFGFAAPGCPTGYIGAGGRADHGRYPECTGGMALYWDTQFFTVNHIYPSPTCRTTYSTGPFDPEGILGSLNSIVLCFLGTHAGRILVKYKDDNDRIRRWGVCCLILGLLGASLCGFRKWGGPIPINKNLWSASFIYVMSGTGCGMLALLYYIIDVKQWWSGAPFYFPGMNSIVIYFCSEAFSNYFPMSFHARDNHWWALFGNLLGVLSMILIAYVLHRKKIFISL